MQRSRFAKAFPTSMIPAQFVDQLSANMGVGPSTTDRAAAISEFGSSSASSDAAARARALRLVAENQAVARDYFNRAFVLMEYYGYLRRNPSDAPEQNRDCAGYDFWLGKLDRFGGNFRAAEMVKAFTSSIEYHQRFPR